MDRRDMIKRSSGFVALGLIARIGGLLGLTGVAPLVMKSCDGGSVLTWTDGMVAAIQAGIRILSAEVGYQSLVARLTSLVKLAQDFGTAFKNGIPTDIASAFDLLSSAFETLADDLGIIKSVRLRIAVEAAIAGVSIFLHLIANKIKSIVESAPNAADSVAAAAASDPKVAAHVETIRRVAATEPWGKTIQH